MFCELFSHSGWQLHYSDILSPVLKSHDLVSTPNKKFIHQNRSYPISPLSNAS
ncbi:hypothetical protein BH11BAC3_BH11BAC3_28360 [soil metagenome]